MSKYEYRLQITNTNSNSRSIRTNTPFQTLTVHSFGSNACLSLAEKKQNRHERKENLSKSKSQCLIT